MCKMKVCTKCGIELDVSMFGKQTKSNDRLKQKCKSCEKEIHKKYYEKNKDKILKKTNQYKKENIEKIKEDSKKYSEKNSDKLSEYHKKYSKENADKISEYHKKYYEENTDKVKDASNKYRKENTEERRIYYKKYCEENADKVKECNKKWYTENPENNHMRSQRRKARKLLLPSTFTVEEWEQCKIHFDNKCCYCGEELKLTQEHFKSVMSGGGYTKENIIPACGSCNYSKQDRDFYLWYPKYKFYSKEREDKILEYLEINKEEQLISAI